MRFNPLGVHSPKVSVSPREVIQCEILQIEILQLEVLQCETTQEKRLAKQSGQAAVLGVSVAHAVLAVLTAHTIVSQVPFHFPIPSHLASQHPFEILKHTLPNLSHFHPGQILQTHHNMP